MASRTQPVQWGSLPDELWVAVFGAIDLTERCVGVGCITLAAQAPTWPPPPAAATPDCRCLQAPQPCARLPPLG